MGNKQENRASGPPENNFVRDPLSYRDPPGGPNTPKPIGPQTKEDVLKLGDVVDKFAGEPAASDLKDFLLYQGLTLGILSDVTVHISKVKQYHLHRFILAQSPVFREHFETLKTFDPDQCVNLDILDNYVDIEAVEHIINRIYGNFGDRYYECKNLIPLMATCARLGLVEWFHGYLDRSLARLSADNLLELVDFALDDTYSQWVEPQVQPIVRTYMIRFGTHLGIEVWRRLPAEWVVDIITDDGLIYTSSHVDDKRKELGYCKVIVGREFDRWSFIRDMYLDRLGLTNDLLRRSRGEGALPPHITQELIEKHSPLFDLLNSSLPHYCNMHPVQWKEIRRERFLNVSQLIRPDVIADGVCQGVILRRLVEGADPDARKLNLCYPLGTEAKLDEVLTYDVPKFDRRVYRPRRVEVRSDPVPKSRTPTPPLTTDTGTNIPTPIDHICTFPPTRFSVEFQFHRGIGAMSPDTPLAAEPVFYAGSWWQFWIQRSRDPADPADRVNMYLRRVGHSRTQSDASSTSRGSWTTFSELNYEEFTREALTGRFSETMLDQLLDGEDGTEFYTDHRRTINAYFRVYAPSAVAGYDPEKFIMIDDREFPKIKCPAIAKTTLFESRPTEFPLDYSVMVPGRLLLSEVEEAQELHEFVSDSSYIKAEVDRIMEGGPVNVPRKKKSDFVTAYERIGEVMDEDNAPDRLVARALFERDTVWANMKFAIVIGVV
ncbi:hypothetical protein DRE_01024 [Drechslerella stenobrocha 248]|uniref:BTB domain-containing protein n=1 Tax=Drechslerella stenobrocha 248 TaxID=1043628 RepID=W7I7N5_9PEZI|nr:hypothetical protein DRE_01024 [Drechslerella stenobrocha 248]